MERFTWLLLLVALVCGTSLPGCGASYMSEEAAKQQAEEEQPEPPEPKGGAPDDNL